MRRTQKSERKVPLPPISAAAEEESLLATIWFELPAQESRREKVYRLTYRMQPQEKIQLIRGGLPSGVVSLLSKDMSVTKDALISWLGLSRATVNRKDRQGEALSQHESERVLGIGALIGQVQTMVQESGDPHGFDAAKWVAQWLSEPLPALNGERPLEYLDTIEGQRMVSGLLAMAQTGAYA